MMLVPLTESEPSAGCPKLKSFSQQSHDTKILFRRQLLVDSEPGKLADATEVCMIGNSIPSAI